MSEETLDMDTVEFWAINVGNEEGVPAVEQDMSNGEFNVLVFTSQEAAKKYCYMQRPQQINSIYKMTRRVKNGKVEHSGLIRIARTCMRNYKQITGVLFDHPGTLGLPVKYASIESVAGALKHRIPKEKVRKGDLIDYLMQLEKEDSL